MDKYTVNIPKTLHAIRTTETSQTQQVRARRLEVHELCFAGQQFRLKLPPLLFTFLPLLFSVTEHITALPLCGKRIPVGIGELPIG